jgi:hypothetical protein
MAYTNSPLVKYTKLSPNHSGQRTKPIDTITIHCVVGHCSLETLGNVFAPSSRQASSNYGVDDNGNVGMYCEEKNRSWCTSSSANDQRAVTIEVASDTQHPYKITDGALQGTIKLCADICQRNGIKKLLWKGDKNLIGQVDKQNMTVHRWFANKACPGDYIYGKLGYIADEVNKLLGNGGTIVSPSKPEPAQPVKPSVPDTKFPYLVIITGSTVNYRKGPGTNYPIVGQVHKNEVYTIVDESKGSGASMWGKLKSGAGWVSLDYCKRK